MEKQPNKISFSEVCEVLKNSGYKVLRFWNNDVLNNINSVLEVIRREVFDKKY